MSNFGVSWTDEMIADLTISCDRGYSASQIASVLNKKYLTAFTRNSIIGKIHRMEAKGRTFKRTRGPKKSSTPAAPRKKSSLSKIYIHRDLKGALPAIDDVMPLAVEDVFPYKRPGEVLPMPKTNISILQLSEDTCRWPLGSVEDRPPYRYCGCVPRGGSPYCAEHAAKARGYVPPKQTEEQRRASYVNNKRRLKASRFTRG